jgi:hypothetical protein
MLNILEKANIFIHGESKGNENIAKAGSISESFSYIILPVCHQPDLRVSERLQSDLCKKEKFCGKTERSLCTTFRIRLHEIDKMCRC